MQNFSDDHGLHSIMKVEKTLFLKCFYSVLFAKVRRKLSDVSCADMLFIDMFGTFNSRDYVN